jgi:hypothetical protein
MIVSQSVVKAWFRAPNWPNSVSKYASTLISKWKGTEKQHWLDFAKKAIQRKRDDEKIVANNAEISRKKLSSNNEPRFLPLTSSPKKSMD